MEAKLYYMEQKTVEVMVIFKNKNNLLNQVHKSIVYCLLYIYSALFLLLLIVLLVVIYHQMFDHKYPEVDN